MKYDGDEEDRKEDKETVNSRNKGAAGEIWKDIPGYEGLYQASNLGRIKSLPKYNNHYERIMKQTINPRDKRLSVILCKNPQAHKRISVHRLVALSFIENPNGYAEVNHKDENPQNNTAENLEWCSRKYNMNYGTTPKRLNIKKKKSVIGIREDGKELMFDSVGAGKEKGFDSSGILYSIRTGKKYKGVIWKYANQQ